MYPGCISDKELTKKSGILDLLEPGDSVMVDRGVDRGFDIEEDLMLKGVIPLFLCGMEQFLENKLKCIASLCLHAERAMERIKIVTYLIVQCRYH